MLPEFLIEDITEFLSFVSKYVPSSPSSPPLSDAVVQIRASGAGGELAGRTDDFHARLPLDSLHEEPLPQGSIRRGSSPFLSCILARLTRVRRSCITSRGRCRGILEDRSEMS